MSDSGRARCEECGQYDSGGVVPCACWKLCPVCKANACDNRFKQCCQCEALSMPDYVATNEELMGE